MTSQWPDIEINHALENTHIDHDELMLFRATFHPDTREFVGLEQVTENTALNGDES